MNLRRDSTPDEHNTFGLILTGGRHRSLVGMKHVAERDTALEGTPSHGRRCAGGEHCSYADTHGLPPARTAAGDHRSLFGPVMAGLVTSPISVLTGGIR